MQTVTLCADYVECFECKDGNPGNEYRVDYFVKLKGEKIVKCGAFDKPLGIVSVMPELSVTVVRFIGMVSFLQMILEECSIMMLLFRLNLTRKEIL